MAHHKCSECDKEGNSIQELREQGCTSPESEIDFFPDETEDSEDKRSDAKKLFDHALTKIDRLVISENNSNEVYAVVKKTNGVDTFQINSRGFQDWLWSEYTRNINSDDIKTDNFFKNVTSSIFSHAKMNGAETAPVYIRIAQLKDEIWYDLGRSDGKVIKITTKKITTEFLDLKSPIFRKNQSLQEQVMPKHEDEQALEKLVDLLRISPKDRLVFMVNLICLFLEAYPMPLIVIGGPAGSFKTTTTAFVKRIVDPDGNQKEDNVSSFPTNIDDLDLQLYNRYLTCFDNVSKISKEQSNHLCRAISGNTVTKRKLYTDTEESILSFMRKITVNGIALNLDYEDLQTRLLSYERESVDEKDRLTEEQLNEKFNELLPNVLGEIFITLQKTLFWRKSLKDSIERGSRMADFKVWGEIIARVLGCKDDEFLNAYNRKLHDAVISLEESYPIITVLDDFMKEQGSYEGTAAELYSSLLGRADALQIEVRSKWVRFPKAPNGLGRAFKEIDSMLKSNGLEVHKSTWTGSSKIHSKHSIIFKITKRNPQMTLGESSSPSSSASS